MLMCAGMIHVDTVHTAHSEHRLRGPCTGVSCRTYHWQAPETLLGWRASYPADIFSYGVILLEIITGDRQERGRYSRPM